MDQTIKTGQRVKAKTAEEKLGKGHILNGRYIIERFMGQDGTGVRYEGWDDKRGIRVAITEYRPINGQEDFDPDDAIGQAKREKAILKQMEQLYNRVCVLKRFSDNGQIGQIQDYFVENQRAYMVEEYLDGILLKDYVAQRGGRVPAEEVFGMMEPVIKALGDIHRQGLVHLNISPSSLVRMPDNSLKLTNFDLTESGQAVQGCCLPPERLSPQGERGAWTDVYGVCGVIYYCLTGKYPPQTVSAGARGWLDFPPDVKLKPAARKKALEKGLAPGRQERIQNMDLLYQMLYKDKPFWQKWKFFVPAAALCAAALAATFTGGKEKEAEEDIWEVEEYERGSSNGNILNGGRCYADETGEYFIDSKGFLCFMKAEEEEAVKVLGEKVKYLNVLQDQIFFYAYEAGGIYSMQRDKEVVTKVADTTALDEKGGKGIYGLSAVRDNHGDRLYYGEFGDGIGRIVSCGFDGGDRQVLLEDGRPDEGALSVYKGYVYYQDGSGAISRMRTDGTNPETLNVKDHILTFLADNDELYLLSIDGSSILVTDLEGNKTEEVEGVSLTTLNVKEDWVYFQDQEGCLCKSRRDGENRIQMWKYGADSISICNDALHVTGREKGYENSYRIFYDMEQGEYCSRRMNPFHYDYMRGSEAVNGVYGSGQVVAAQEKDGGAYYVDRDRIILQKEDGYTVVLSNRDDPRYLNMADGKLYFVEDENKIIQWDLSARQETVLAAKYNSIYYLSLVNDKLYYESSGTIYSFDLETRAEEVLAEESEVYYMNVIDGYIFWRNPNGEVLTRLDWRGERKEIYKGSLIKRMGAVDGRIYIQDKDKVLALDYDGNILFEWQGPDVFSLVNGDDEWIYLITGTSLIRVSTISGEEKTLVAYGVDNSAYYLLDGQLYIAKKDGYYVEKIYRIDPEESKDSLEETEVFAGEKGYIRLSAARWRRRRG